MKNILLGCKLIACLQIFALILHWKVSVLPFQLIFQLSDLSTAKGVWVLYFVITGIIFVLLNLISAIGLFAGKKWGFILSYLAIISSTLVGVSYLPFSYGSLYKFFLSQPSIIPVIIINSVLFCTVLYLHISYRKMIVNSSS